MNSNTGNSMQDMCRTCMIQFSRTKKKNNQTKQSIHVVPTGCTNNTSIMELLQLVQPQIKIDAKDNLPNQICSNCIQKLLVAHEFIEMYKNVDEKFRKMLMEADIANKNFEEPEECLEEEDDIQEALVKGRDICEITKYEFEIEQINMDGYEVAEENENDWAEFDDEFLQELSDDAERNEPYFPNPYSDVSDCEWIPHEICDSSKKKCVQNSDNKFIDDVKNSTSAYVPEEKISKKGKQKDRISFTIKSRQHQHEKISKRKSNQSEKNQSNKIKCEQCGKGFSRISCYEIHMRKHTGEQPYLCIECGKGFKTVGSLNTHMLRHKGEKTVQCPHCPKKFVCASGLYGHMMVHTKEKPFVCDICGSAFHMAYQLRKHNLYHNGIKNYACEYCEMKFVTREKQHRHMRTHTGEKPYRCKYCERAFAQSNDCVKHLRQHLGDNVYQCELCPLRFPLARDLRRHFATHKDDDEETRARNLEARIEEEKNLQIKLDCKEI